MPRRIGVLGGTFDPVHLAHVELAKCAIKQCQFRELIVVPCAQPAHRELAQASNEQRLDMLKLAFSSLDNISFCDYELTKPSTSFTVETLEFLSGCHPDSQLVFCLGADSLRDFTHWHRWQDILSLAHLAVMHRESSSASDEEGVGENFLMGRAVSALTDINKPAGQIFEIETPEMPVSATLIREHVRASLQDVKKQFERDAVLGKWLDPKVLNYIVNNKVYQ